MHPRNIYKKSTVNFNVLADKYPNIRPFMRVSLTGNVKYQFKEPSAVSELSRALLHKDFGLDVELPPDKLVPTITLRLNYLLWIEDLISETCNVKGNDVSGVDIGTGASCVFALLAAKKGWKMLATELNPTSVEIAKRNIERNQLTHLITLKQVEDKSMCFKGVIDQNERYHFSMCNPPFFDKSSSKQQRTDKRPPPNNGATGSVDELFTDGGEVEFIGKMIAESKELRDNITIYSTMLGHRRNIKLCEAKLDEAKVKSRVTHYFQQGRTTRWGIAWSFCIDLPQKGPWVDTPWNASQLLPINFELPSNVSPDKASKRLEELFDELKVTYKLKEQFKWHVVAYDRTWVRKSHLKRDRKPHIEMQEPASTSDDEPPAKINKFNDNVDEQVTNPAHADTANKTHTEVSQAEANENVPSSSVSKSVMLEFETDINQVRGNYVTSLTLLAGSGGKGGIFELCQFLKNNFPAEGPQPFWGENGTRTTKDHKKRRR